MLGTQSKAKNTSEVTLRTGRVRRIQEQAHGQRLPGCHKVQPWDMAFQNFEGIGCFCLGRWRDMILKSQEFKNVPLEPGDPND